jgi:hypothetical protein
MSARTWWTGIFNSINAINTDVIIIPLSLMLIADSKVMPQDNVIFILSTQTGISAQNNSK